ncbi:TetR/AcrR family transcriptional regulator [Aquabacterium parvum]|uniref:TetR/AcrR family transcriptional regulator n=1 Tax=Aquabacterium parvum TaxID=70584 RepID=UPI000718ADBA|nr:TetR/AcrR family transcriptional regulator [Aquabacterium parvum]MBU0915330.1 TetR/AcrR family transcriptional regulator [Gammaproteobacteria bacterium]
MRNQAEVATPTRTYRGETAQARREQRRAKLLEAALDCFATRGVAHTTMRDICSQARLTDRYFYESFRNTKDAYEAVDSWQKDLLVAHVAAAMSNAPLSLLDQAKAGLSALYSFLREDARRAHVLLLDGFSGAALPNAQGTQEALAQYIPLIRATAQRLYPRMNPNFDLELMGRGLLGMAVQVGTVWARSGYAHPLDEVVAYNLYAWRGLNEWVNELSETPRAA